MTEMATETSPVWYVQLADGSEFGPVDEKTLIVWAREGRIEPSSLISTDGENWFSATQKPELHMEWLVETEPGVFFGPFHHDVIKELLDSGTLSLETRTFKYFDREASANDKKAVEKLTADLDEAKSELGNVKSELDRTKGGLKAAETAKAEAEKRADELTAKLKVAQAETEKRSNEYETALEAAKVAQAEAEKRADDLTAKFKVAHEESERAKALSADEQMRAKVIFKRLKTVKSDNEKLEKLLAEEKALSTELKANLKEAKASAETEAKNSDDLRKELEKLKKNSKPDSSHGLFSGRSKMDLSSLEMAARRELSAKRFGMKPPDSLRMLPRRKPDSGDVIDV